MFWSNTCTGLLKSTSMEVDRGLDQCNGLCRHHNIPTQDDGCFKIGRRELCLTNPKLLIYLYPVALKNIPLQKYATIHIHVYRSYKTMMMFVYTNQTTMLAIDRAVVESSHTHDSQGARSSHMRCIMK